jgi:hypothetical protein
MPLSIFENGKSPAVIVAGLVLFTSRIGELRNGTEITFEVFRSDAARLKALIGKTEYYVIDEKTHFFGQLKSLEPCVDPDTRIIRLSDRTTFRGVLVVFVGEASQQ